MSPAQLAQQQAQERAEQQLTLLQMQEAQRRRWERLFLTTIEMSEPELRAALKHPSSERRFVATYVVGERLLEWQTDLLRLLEDKSEAVRQAARRGLIGCVRTCRALLAGEHQDPAYGDENKSNHKMVSECAHEDFPKLTSYLSNQPHRTPSGVFSL